MICRLNLVCDRMSQLSLRQVARIALFAAPVAKAGSEFVGIGCRDVFRRATLSLGPSQERGENHVREWNCVLGEGGRALRVGQVCPAIALHIFFTSHAMDDGSEVEVGPILEE